MGGGLSIDSHLQEGNLKMRKKKQMLSKQKSKAFSYCTMNVTCRMNVTSTLLIVGRIAYVTMIKCGSES
jgi:hypothetical protein